MVGRDGVQHDQEDIGEPGGGNGRGLLARLLDPVDDPRARPPGSTTRGDEREADRDEPPETAACRSRAEPAATPAPSVTTNQARP